MAYTVSGVMCAVVGNYRLVGLRITADAATAQIDTGLGNIAQLATGFQSATTGAIKFAMNKGVAGTAIAGSIGITGATSGDEMLVTVYGN